MKEHQRSELKQHWRDEYLRWISRFANAQGGTLEIGKNDRGEVVGVANAAKLLEEIPDKVCDILGITVEVNLHTERGNDWLEIVMDPYPTPISYRAEYHYRSGNTKQELKGAALERFLLRNHRRRWDDAPIPGLHIRDCSQAALKLFKSSAAKCGRMTEEVPEDSTESLLDNLQLPDGNYLRRATALLFCDNPEQFVSGAYTKIGFFLTHGDLRYQGEIHGSLFQRVEKTLDLLYR